MLCKINANPGGVVSDEKARAINFLRALQAVCTASAGSTPSVTPITAPSTNGSGDCIVEVVSNAEAGGWTSSASTTVTTSYNASNSTYYLLDLYNSSTGKSTYPYAKVSFATNLSYSFNSSYATYPFIDMIIGFHTATTADGNYLSGFSSYGTSGNNYSDYTGRNISGGAGNGTTPGITGSATDSYRGLRPSNGEFLVASTANYIIIANANGLWYYGMRSNAAWENAYTDNPYVFGFNYNCNGNASASSWNSPQTYHSSANQAAFFGYGHDGSGLLSPTPKWSHAFTSTYNAGPYLNYCPVSGGGYYSAYPYVTFGGSGLGGMCGQIMPFGLRSATANTMVGPSTDSSTGANVPPAYPIVASFAGGPNHWQFSSIRALTGMVLPGMYRSLAGSDAYMNQYYTAGTTYVVGTENYYPYTIGNNTSFKDLMLIRKY